MTLNGFPSNDCTMGPYPNTVPCNFSVFLKAKNRLRQKKEKIQHISPHKKSVYDCQKMYKLQHRLFVTKL